MDSNHGITIQKILPVQILAMLISVLAMLIDGIIIGMYLGDTAQAAYGLISPIVLLITAFGGLISNGIQVLLGRSIGSGDEERNQKLFSTSFWISLFVAFVIMLPLLLVPGDIAVILGANSLELIAFTGSYLRIIALSFPIIVLTLVFSIFLQMFSGKKYIALGVVSLIIIDVALDFVNVYAWHAGMAGMAWASVIAYYLSFLIVSIPLIRKTNLSLRFKYWSWKLIPQIGEYGLFYLVYKLCVVLLNFGMNRLLIRYGTIEHVAANSILNSISLVTGAFASGIGSTITMVESYYVGKRDEKGIRSAFVTMQKISFLMNLGLMILCIVFADWIVGIFHPESEVIRSYALLAVRLFSLSLIWNGINYIYKNCDMSVDDMKKAYVISLLNNFLFPFLLFGLMAGIGAIQYIWIGYAIGQGIATICFVRLHRDTRFALREKVEN